MFVGTNILVRKFPSYFQMLTQYYFNKTFLCIYMTVLYGIHSLQACCIGFGVVIARAIL
jgi:hypothetical protein